MQNDEANTASTEADAPAQMTTENTEVDQREVKTAKPSTPLFARPAISAGAGYLAGLATAGIVALLWSSVEPPVDDQPTATEAISPKPEPASADTKATAAPAPSAPAKKAKKAPTPPRKLAPKPSAPPPKKAASSRPPSPPSTPAARAATPPPTASPAASSTLTIEVIGTGAAKRNALATVFVDGRSVGRAPVRSLPVTAGRHRIRVDCVFEGKTHRGAEKAMTIPDDTDAMMQHTCDVMVLLK